MAPGEDGKLRLWDVATSELLQTARGPGGEFWSSFKGSFKKLKNIYIYIKGSFKKLKKYIYMGFGFRV